MTEDEVWEKHGGKVPKGRLLIKDRISDSMFQQVLLRPDEYSVLATTNLNGDYMSDALAAQVGGLGLAPGSNEGDGIAAVHIPRLTERFYRADAGRSRSLGGTGLGLAIVKHIVERHRGRLDIASQVGVGTTVSVILPPSGGAAKGAVIKG